MEIQKLPKANRKILSVNWYIILRLRKKPNRLFLSIFFNFDKIPIDKIHNLPYSVHKLPISYIRYMRKITVKDMKQAVAYVNNGNVCIGNVNDIADEDFLACDFLKDLKMGNIRVANVPTQLMRMYNLDLPLEIFRNAKDNTVGALMDSINDCLAKADEEVDG